MSYWPASGRCCVWGISRDRINCRELGFKGRAGKGRAARVLSPTGRDINPRDNGRTRDRPAEAGRVASSNRFHLRDRTEHEGMRTARTSSLSLLFLNCFQFRRNHAASRIYRVLYRESFILKIMNRVKRN